MATPTMHETYGALLLGVIVAFFLQGMLTVQLYNYFHTFPRDSKFNKCLVVTVWTLDALHLFCISHSIYFYLISSRGDVEVLQESTILLNLHLPLVGVTTLLCQLYFLHRIWLYTGRSILMTGIISAACTATLIIDLIISARLLQNLSVESFSIRPLETASSFILNAVANAAIAGVLCFFLDKSKRESQKTDNILTKLIRYSVGTSVCTCVVAIACTTAYIWKPQTFIFISIHFSLGRMYSNAFMASLNARKNIRPQPDNLHSPFNRAGQHTFIDEDGITRHPGILITKVQATLVEGELD